MHGLGLVVGAGVVSEGKLTLYQGVTLGGNLGRTRGGATQPRLKDGVIVYANAGVFGPVIIGQDVQIKAHSVVTQDKG